MKARAGVALLLALIALVLIEAMTAGVVALTAQARAVAGARSRMMRAQAGAEYAVARVLANWNGQGYDTIAVGGVIAPDYARGTHDDVAFSATVERVSQARYLVRGEAQAGSPMNRVTARALAAPRFLDRQRAIDESTSLIPASDDLPADWSASECPANGISQPVSAEDTTLAVGGVKWSELPSIADQTAGSVLTPSLVDSLFPLIYAPVDLLMVGGRGQGILVVNGNLIMSGTEFIGIVVVRGRVSLLDGSRLVGSVRSARDGLLQNLPGFSYSSCAIRRSALETHSALRQILQPRTYIPAF